MKHLSSGPVLGMVILLACFASAQDGKRSAQGQTTNTPPVCDEQRAILLVEQQVDEGKSIDNSVLRIAILIRAADALWSHREDHARTLFAQAYELAEMQFKEKGDETRKEGRLKIQLEDQRFVVMAAIARHDAGWARRLAERNVEATKLVAAKDVTSANSASIADKMIGLAVSILPADQQVAIRLVRETLGFRPTDSLAFFLFRLAEVNKAAADQLYVDAIGAYANAGVADFLYLSAYPFALNHVIGPEALSTSFLVPQDFVADPRLQGLFLEELFRRAKASIETPEQTGRNAKQLPEAAQVYIALNGVEPLIAQYQPAYAERGAVLKSAIGALLFSDVRQQAANVIRAQSSDQANAFEQYVEKAEHEANSTRKDSLLALAVLVASDAERLDRLCDLIDKISEPGVRRQLLNWLYFKRTQKAIKDGRLYEARALAEKVDQLDHRAYLFYEIAVEALKRGDDRSQARETLDAVAANALKADPTNERARTMLGISHLYARFDQIRAFEIMSEAVKTINKIEEPDVASTRFHQRIEGRTFAHYSTYEVAGFSVENAFRELATFDFERALLLAKSLENKSVRSKAVIALAAVCLDNAARQKKRVIQKPETRKPGPS